MVNPINIIIEIVTYILNVYIVVKSTGKTKDLGVGLLLSRLTLFLFLLPILFQWVSLFYISYLIVGLAVIAIILSFLKKSLVARNYAIITIGYLLFSHIVFQGALVYLLFMFYQDKKINKINRKD